MKVIVLGAGIIGTCSAWYLQQAGHEVHVIERQSGAALETSFANGGQISVSHAQPWANPRTPLKLLKWLGQEDAPLLFRPRADWFQTRWCLQFLRECTRHRSNQNIRQIMALAEYSRLSLIELRAATGIAYDSLQRGILHFYTDQKDFDNSQKAASLMRSLGCPRETLNPQQVIQIEPALSHMQQQIVGGDYTISDESGDAHLFTVGLAKQAQQAGARFSFNTSLTRLITEGSGVHAKVTAIEIINAEGRHQRLQADAFVVALGSFSQPILKPLGIDLMIYPGKGYSATFPVINPDAAPMTSLTDDAYKLVVSRLGNRLRVAGTCEINTYSRELNDTRCALITRRARELFPEACDFDAAQYWCGLRPLTPSNIPYLGKTKFNNLYLNTGHGSLGWTMGAGSGKAICDIINGKTPDLNFQFCEIR